MRMADYLGEIKRQFMDVYGFKPLPGSTKKEPSIKVPDGVYPMNIECKVDYVRVKNNRIINCCNFKKPRSKTIRTKPLTKSRQARQ